MSALSMLGAAVCGVCIMASVFLTAIPHRRTEKVLHLVLGLFVIASMIAPIKALIDTITDVVYTPPEYEIPSEYSDSAYYEAVVSRTADNLVHAADTLLKNEGITPKNIRLSLKIDEDHSITIGQIIIYISREDESKASLIESIIYRNFSKEPQIEIEDG